MDHKLLDGMVGTEQDRREPLLRPGNSNCGGCGMSLSLNMLSRAVRELPIQMAIPACCGIVTPGQYPFSAFGAPVVASTFAASAAVATGLSRVAEWNGESTRVIAFAGDGGTYDIGLATLSAAAERNEDLLYICYDNEIYGNTGGQRSSATPLGATTTTTPSGKLRLKKDIMGIMAAHRIPYAASLSVGHAEDMVAKIRFALELTGFRFLHILSPCPVGWKSEAAEGVELVRLAIRSGLFPVYEVFDGERTLIRIEPEPSREGRREALEAYFGKQGRFRKNEVNVDEVERAIEDQWARLRRQVAAS